MKKGFILIGFILIASLTVTLAAQAGKPAPGAKPFEVYMGLRNKAFNMSPKSAGITLESESEPWGIVMDMGFKKSTATLVALKDGTASLYLSTGGGIIAGREHKNISDFARDFVVSSANFILFMQKTLNCPLPAEGEVNIYVLTPSGIFSSGPLKEEDMANDMDKFSRLFSSGEEVVSALRRLESAP